MLSDLLYNLLFVAAVCSMSPKRSSRARPPPKLIPPRYEVSREKLRKELALCGLQDSLEVFTQLGIHTWFDLGSLSKQAWEETNAFLPGDRRQQLTSLYFTALADLRKLGSITSIEEESDEDEHEC